MTNKAFIKTFLAAIIVLGIIIAGHIAFCGTEEESIRKVIAGTARLSASIFVVAFAASSLNYFMNNNWTRSLVSARPHIGLIFTASHTYHLLSLIYLQSAIHPVFTLAKTTSLLGGGLAYVFILLMAITTFPTFRQKLTARSWKTLHTLGMYWIWIIFFRSYFKQVLNKEEGYVLFTLLLIAFILRLIKFLLSRNK